MLRLGVWWFVFAGVVALGFSAEEKSAWDPARITQRLGTTPITLYVEADLKNSPLVEFINTHARAEDAVVVSYQDALKESARIADLGVKRGEVWIYIPDDIDLVHNARKSIEGIDGIVFIPDPLVAEDSSLRRKARRIAESAKALKVRMIAGLESPSLRKRANIDDVAKHASVFTIYHLKNLRRGQMEYRSHVAKIARDARAANPDIDIEVAISTAATDDATRQLVEVLMSCADLADRIGIYVDESPESRASLELMYRLLRG